jgi:hypothetical protein
MGKKRPAPQLYDVLPGEQLRQSLVESLPEGTTGVWEHLGALRVTGGNLGVVDAGSCHPRYLPSEAGQLDWPYPQADLAVRVAEHADGTRSRVLAVLVMAPAGKQPHDFSTVERWPEATMAIDSATGAVGDYARMLTQCRAGGAMATVLVGKGKAGDAAQQRQRQQAAKVLLQLGLPVAAEASYAGNTPVRFSSGLSDEQIEQARAALSAAGVSEDIWVPSAHTARLLEDQLLTRLLTWHPADADPWLLAFRTGFGDGLYSWDAIVVEGQLCGYLCDFLPAAEEAEEPEVLADAPVVTAEVVDAAVVMAEAIEERSAGAGQRARPLEPGINVAVRRGCALTNWFLGQLIATTEAGYTVRFPSGYEMEVKSGELSPIPDRAEFRAGDLVVFHYGDGEMRPAVVRAASPTHCEVEWHAKEPPRTVAAGELILQESLVRDAWSGVSAAGPPLEREAEAAPLPQDASPPLGPGVAVAVRAGKNKYAFARIANAVKGGFLVEYASGDREKVQEKKLIPLPNRPVFRTGDAVIAVWSQARMNPGRITALSPAGYAVAWESGFAPQIVPLGSLTFAAWG